MNPRATLLPIIFAFFLTFSLAAQPLPSGYDLRSVAVDGGIQAWVSAIQNHGTAEDCWTFAPATAMDSNLLKVIFPRKREGLLLLFGFMVLGGFEVERGFIAEGLTNS